MKPAKLKKARAVLGVTQIQLAKMLDLKVGTISRYERGEHKIPLLLELAVCELKNRAADKTIGL